MFGFGFFCSIILTALVIFLVTLGAIPYSFSAWALLLPLTSFLLVLSLGIQRISQRSSDFKLSGLSEIINKTVFAFISIFSGLLGSPAIMLGIAVAGGYFAKLLVIMGNLKLNLFKMSCSFNDGLKLIKNLKFEKLIGSLVFSHFILAITGIAPLWLIASKYGNEYLGYFTLVAGTLGLLTRVIGQAIGQVYYQAASTLFQKGDSFSYLFLNNLKFISLMSLPLFAIVLFFGSELYGVIFGNNWITSGFIAEIYVVAAAAWFISVPFEKSSLIVNAWWYSPIYQFIRMILNFVVIYLTISFNLSFETFLVLLTSVITATSLADCLASYLFSSRHKPF